MNEPCQIYKQRVGFAKKYSTKGDVLLKVQREFHYLPKCSSSAILTRTQINNQSISEGWFWQRHHNLRCCKQRNPQTTTDKCQSYGDTNLIVLFRKMVGTEKLSSF